MAEGGSSPGHFALLEEPSHRKRAAIEALFDRLVEKTKNEVRDSTEKLFERGAIDMDQKETVIKTLSLNHLQTDYAASLLFRLILKNVEDRDDRHFDRLVYALRDMELDGLANELLRASEIKTRPSNLSAEQAMEQDLSIPDPPKKIATGEEFSLYDSGFAPPSYSVSSVQGDGTEVSALSTNHDHPIIETFTDAPTQGQLASSETDESQVEEEQPLSLSPASTLVELQQHTLPVVPSGDNMQGSALQSQPLLQEIEDNSDLSSAENSNDQEPVQEESTLSNSSSLVVSTLSVDYTDSTPKMDKIGGNIDELSQELTKMRLDLQTRERELVAKEQEMQRNPTLLLRCKKLEEDVVKMEEEVQTQKRRADRISNEKDIEINSWRKQCEEKESEIKMLRVTIARQEREKRELNTMHMAEIKKLKQRQDEYARELDNYQERVTTLDNALKEANDKKDVAEQQLKEANAKCKEAETEQLKAVIKLLQDMCEKEKELSLLKEAKLKLEIEIKELECRNKSLDVVNKEQEALLHQKDKELAEHKQAAAEEKHNTCAQELKSQRRRSKQLQDENSQLKRQLSEVQERVSAEESLAKRSKTS